VSGPKAYAIRRAVQKAQFSAVGLFSA